MPLLALFAEFLRDHPFTLYILFTPAYIDEVRGDGVKSPKAWKNACMQDDRFVFDDDSGVCVKVESEELAGKPLCKQGVALQGVKNMMDKMIREADKAKNGQQKGVKFDYTDRPRYLVHQRALDTLKAMKATGRSGSRAWVSLS